MCKHTISVFKFMEMFLNEQKTIEWFEQKRWCEKVECPSCADADITWLKCHLSVV